MRTANFLIVTLSAITIAACSANSNQENLGVEDAPLTQKCGESASGPVQGRDVSYYQGNFNWKAAGVEFGYARISDGTGFIDPDFNSNWANLKAAGLLRGAYQFFEPGEDVAAQANLVIEKVGKLGAGDLPVQLDIEVTGGRSPAEIQAAAHQWLDLVEAGTGKKPFVYSYGSFLQSNLGAGFGAYPLWIAAYGEACPNIPPGWSNWVMWQYSDGGGALDHDVFNGSMAQLEALSGSTGGARKKNGDVVSIAFTDTGSKMTEAHVLSRSSNFSAFSLHIATALGMVDDKEWAFVTGDYDNDGIDDLYALSLDGRSHSTEVHVLSGASNYQTFLLHTATPLEPTNRTGWTFAAGDYDKDGVDDLYAIDFDGASKTTEVHILSGASHFQTWLLHAATGLQPTNATSWQFVTGDYDGDGRDDLYALALDGFSKSTEVHILSAASEFKTFVLHTATPLQPTNTTEWAFVTADYDGDGKSDLYALSLDGASKSTEVHILSGGSNFGTWLLHAASGLHPTSPTGWAFATK